MLVFQAERQKLILACSSAHSKLVKRGIINFGFKNDLLKSCSHLVHRYQVSCLLDAGYLLPPVAVVGSFLKKSNSDNRNAIDQVTQGKKESNCHVLPTQNW